MKRITLIFVGLVLAINFPGNACTTAIISGKYTPDGRPLLWKHRDTGFLNNKIVHFNDGKYSYTGLVNSGDHENKSVWIGFNSEGFAIMNSASYNLNNDTITLSGHEGRLMKKALQTCATIDDFEELLKSLNQPIKLEANFGVIDAYGGAAYFELGNFKYEKIDVNDPKIAPYGYVLRTNYSTTGEMGIGGGYIRFETADQVLKMAVKETNLTPKTIIRKASHNLFHSLTKVDLNDYSEIAENTETFVCFEDFIPRKSSSSSVVVQGVRTGEDPACSTMWTVLGWPLSTVCVPVWLHSKVELPSLLLYQEKIKDAPMCHLGLELKKECFPYEWGTSSKKYMNVNALLNANNTGILQILEPFEDEIFEKAEALLGSWRKTKIKPSEMEDFYDWINREIPAFYSKNFNVRIKHP
ncbi:MAG: hypothetical protein KAX05_07595 [Bacteroidales bacterium]|nr:hypothetical protein [Bacteroidales bacterium]